MNLHTGSASVIPAGSADMYPPGVGHVFLTESRPGAPWGKRFAATSEPRRRIVMWTNRAGVSFVLRAWH